MVGASKILTVSYGTFSCTLEGFDEPFNTMKAIAEYFRDLAADDRYFGAEPATPDAAMLHQIAEREMKRRVVAKVQDNGVILRATDSPNPTLATPLHEVAPAAPLTTTVSEPTKSESMFEDQHAYSAPAADLAATKPATEAAQSAISDSVAAKLSRIRNAMAETRASGETTRPPMSLKAALAAAEAEEAAKAEAEAAEKAEAEAEAAEKAKAEAEARAEVEAAQTLDTSADDTLPASFSEAIDDEDHAPDGHSDDGSSGEPDDDIDADLPPLTFSEADDDDTLMASLAAAMTDPLPATHAKIATDDSVEILAEDFSEELVALDETTVAQADSDNAFEDNFEGELGDDTAPVEVPLSFGEGFATDIGQLDDMAIAPVEPPKAETPKAETPAPEVNDKLRRARARVIKIRRVQEPEAHNATDKGNAENPSALSPEAEADLMRELAEVRGEDTIPDADSPISNVAPVRPQRPTSPRRKTTAPQPNALRVSEDDASVKRLLDQTNSEFQGPENRRRLSAISHLKAAVAATVADRISGGDKGPTDEMRMNPYRNDLERAVRPRPAQLAPTGERPAPLMLVSEQRIDTPRIKPSPSQTHISPVRPRRVPAGNLALTAEDEDEDDFQPATDGSDARNIFGSTTSFAEYAEKLGAENLPDLLEAAVAYSLHVEGHPDVSRPQMMEKVLSVQPALGEDRETMLRCFGSLLRDGRIEKVRRGHFSLSETSPIQAEARKAAQD